MLRFTIYQYLKLLLVLIKTHCIFSTTQRLVCNADKKTPDDNILLWQNYQYFYNLFWQLTGRRTFCSCCLLRRQTILCKPLCYQPKIAQLKIKNEFTNRQLERNWTSSVWGTIHTFANVSFFYWRWRFILKTLDSVLSLFSSHSASIILRDAVALFINKENIFSHIVSHLGSQLMLDNIFNMKTCTTWTWLKNKNCLTWNTKGFIKK